MTMLEFNASFGTEEQCREYLFKQKWPNGFICPKCGHDQYFNIASRKRYQCKACNHQPSVTTGTIMDKTHTPLVKWFLAMYLISTDKRGVSALSLKSKLGISYNTAWTMTHKIRHAMGKRDEGFKLDGIVEFDDAFFGGASEGGKRGRGTEKTAVLTAISLTDEGKPKYAKMQVVASVDGKVIKSFANKFIAKSSDVYTDGFPAYAPLVEDGYVLFQYKHDPRKQPEHLHWAHIIISNAKSFINGTFHGLDSIHLQRYLDEFCFRLNRRWHLSFAFPSLCSACVFSGVIRNHELVG